MGEFQEENKKAGTLFLEIKTNCYVLSLTEIQLTPFNVITLGQT
jgi:hypothetical protein